MLSVVPENIHNENSTIKLKIEEGVFETLVGWSKMLLPGAYSNLTGTKNYLKGRTLRVVRQGL